MKHYFFTMLTILIVSTCHNTESEQNLKFVEIGKDGKIFMLTKLKPSDIYYNIPVDFGGQPAWLDGLGVNKTTNEPKGTSVQIAYCGEFVNMIAPADCVGKWPSTYGMMVSGIVKGIPFTQLFDVTVFDFMVDGLKITNQEKAELHALYRAFRRSKDPRFMAELEHVSFQKQQIEDYIDLYGTSAEIEKKLSSFQKEIDRLESVIKLKSSERIPTGILQAVDEIMDDIGADFALRIKSSKSPAAELKSSDDFKTIAWNGVRGLISCFKSIQVYNNQTSDYSIGYYDPGSRCKSERPKFLFETYVVKSANGTPRLERVAPTAQDLAKIPPNGEMFWQHRGKTCTDFAGKGHCDGTKIEQTCHGSVKPFENPGRCYPVDECNEKTCPCSCQLTPETFTHSKGY